MNIERNITVHLSIEDETTLSNAAELLNNIFESLGPCVCIGNSDNHITSDAVNNAKDIIKQLISACDTVEQIPMPPTWYN